MVKQSVLYMSGFFTGERFGKPQVLAGLLLLVFLAECGWLIAHETSAVVSAEEYARVQEGIAQWRGRMIAGTPAGTQTGVEEAVRMRGDAYDSDHSPLWYLIESAPVALFRIGPDSRLWLWFTRGPYVFMGTLLGASLWYVSRRLYGNAAGYVALTLYCFSPAVLRCSTLWIAQPDVAAAWGTFGAVFTAIAVSHTLYAPREVVLWNWRRILLLGVSLTLAIGSQFSLAIILPALLPCMIYLAPDRKAAAVTIWAAAVGVFLILLFASYFFHPMVFWRGLASARLVPGSWRAMLMAGAYLQLFREMRAAGPILSVMVPAAVITYAAWGRSRYFGSTAPLLFAVLFGILRVAAPHDPDSVYSLAAVTFVFVFVAGMAADLLETKIRELTAALILGLVSANALWNLIALARVGR